MSNTKNAAAQTNEVKYNMQHPVAGKRVVYNKGRSIPLTSSGKTVEKGDEFFVLGMLPENSLTAACKPIFRDDLPPVVYIQHDALDIL